MPGTGTERNQALDSVLKVFSCSQSAFIEHLLCTGGMPTALQCSLSWRSPRGGGEIHAMPAYHVLGALGDMCCRSLGWVGREDLSQLQSERAPQEEVLELDLIVHTGVC